MTTVDLRKKELSWDWPAIRLISYFTILLIAGSVWMFVLLASSILTPFPYAKWILPGIVLTLAVVSTEIAVTRKSVPWQYTILPLTGYYVVPLVVYTLIVLSTSSPSL